MKSFVLKIIYGLIVLLSLTLILQVFGVQIFDRSIFLSIILYMFSWYFGYYIYSLVHMINVIEVKNIGYSDYGLCTESEALIQYKMKQYSITAYYASTPLPEKHIRFFLFKAFKNKTVLDQMKIELTTDFKLFSEGVSFFTEPNIYLKEPIEIRVIKNQ